MKASDLGFGEGKSLGLVGGAGLLKNGVTNGVSMDLGEYIQTAIRKAQEADQLRAQLSHEITLRGKIQGDANQQVSTLKKEVESLKKALESQGQAHSARLHELRKQDTTVDKLQTKIDRLIVQLHHCEERIKNQKKQIEELTENLEEAKAAQDVKDVAASTLIDYTKLIVSTLVIADTYRVKIGTILTAPAGYEFTGEFRQMKAGDIYFSTLRQAYKGTADDEKNPNVHPRLILRKVGQ